jgi:hypothetical protein
VRNGINVALFTPRAFAATVPGPTTIWHCVAARDRVEYTKRDYFDPRSMAFPRSDFEVDGELPAPAA